MKLHRWRAWVTLSENFYIFYRAILFMIRKIKNILLFITTDLVIWRLMSFLVLSILPFADCQNRQNKPCFSVDQQLVILNTFTFSLNVSKVWCCPRLLKSGKTNIASINTVPFSSRFYIQWVKICSTSVRLGKTIITHFSWWVIRSLRDHDENIHVPCTVFFVVALKSRMRRKISNFNNSCK